jgi:hypothetical protein
MGVDWVRRTEDKYRHCLQTSQQTLATPPLFPAEEQITVTYPCHWLTEERTVPVGTPLTIFQRSEKARIAVLLAAEAVGEVRGEAAADIRRLFHSHPELCNALPVIVVRTGAPTAPFYVEVVRGPRGRG